VLAARIGSAQPATGLERLNPFLLGNRTPRRLYVTNVFGAIGEALLWGFGPADGVTVPAKTG
jgi:hypothetical protein